MGVALLANMLGVTETKARQIKNELNRAMPFRLALSDKCKQDILRVKYITLIDGARRHWVFDERGRPEKPHSSMNALIQGSAARHTKRWMLACWREEIVPLLQMHDALEVSLTTLEQAERIRQLGREAVSLTIPMLIDAQFGPTWGNAKYSWDELNGATEKDPAGRGGWSARPDSTAPTSPANFAAAEPEISNSVIPELGAPKPIPAPLTTTTEEPASEEPEDIPDTTAIPAAKIPDAEIPETPTEPDVRADAEPKTNGTDMREDTEAPRVTQADINEINDGLRREGIGPINVGAADQGDDAHRDDDAGPIPEANRTEITLFTKSDGPLTKCIKLADDGSIKGDGSACLMAVGEAHRVEITGVRYLAAWIDSLESNQAIALGALRDGLPEKVAITTKARLNGERHVIARTGDAITYRKQQPAFVLLDFDTKEMPDEVAAAIKRNGGFWPSLLTVLPNLADVARVTRSSTSAGLFRSDTGEKLRGSDGVHVFLLLQDGTDSERFLKALHDRCWLAGLGWYMVGAGGQLLERSIVDRMVGNPERLVFEGGPILVPPLQQDRKSRAPKAVNGIALDTVTACPPPTIVETAKLEEIKAKAARRLAPAAAKAHTSYVEQKAKDVAERTGLTMNAARRVIKRQCDGGILLPDVVLPFDNKEFAGCTAGDVLADPERFEGTTLADPVEGVAYGTCIAKIMRRPDGTPWIHSFAHGRATYELKYDAAAVRKAIEQADKSEVAETFAALVVNADLNDVEERELLDLVAKCSGAGVRPVTRLLKTAQKKHAREQAKEERQRRTAARADPRPAILNPDEDAPWLPMVQTLEDVHSASTAGKPPERDIDGGINQARKLPIPTMHAFTKTTE